MSCHLRELGQFHLIHVVEVRGTTATCLITSGSSINCIDIKIAKT